MDKFDEIVKGLDTNTQSPPGLFKYKIGQEVYVKHFKKNGVISHREFNDNGEHIWVEYIVRVVHEDGRSEAIECTELWIEPETKRED